MGMLFGGGFMSEAVGSGMLLTVNIVCVNLSAKIVFFLKNIKPRTTLELEQAKHSSTLYVLIWLLSIVVLTLAIYWGK